MPSPTLNLKYTRSDDNFSIVVTDLTGAYNATTNPGGYGGPNPAVADFTDFLITVTLPDAGTLLPAGTPIVVNAFPSLPSNASGTFSLTSLALIGVADTILVDGVYLFSVAATYGGAEEGIAEDTTYKPLFEIVECCLENMAIEAIGCACSGDSKKIQSLTKAFVGLELLRAKVVNDVVVPSAIENCEQWDKAATLILELQDICENENCQGCNGCT